MNRYAEPDFKSAALIMVANFSNCPRASIVEARERDLRVVVVSDASSGFDARDQAKWPTLEGPFCQPKNSWQSGQMSPKANREVSLGVVPARSSHN
jgi:hypothetical protein